MSRNHGSLLVPLACALAAALLILASFALEADEHFGHPWPDPPLPSGDTLLLPEYIQCDQCIDFGPGGPYLDCNHSELVPCPDHPVDPACTTGSVSPPIGCALCWDFEEPLPGGITEPGIVCFLWWADPLFLDGFESGDTSAWSAP